MNRRGFLKGILAAGVAPAVVSSGVLMPIIDLITPAEIEDEVFYAIVHPCVAQDLLNERVTKTLNNVNANAARAWSAAMFMEAMKKPQLGLYVGNQWSKGLGKPSPAIVLNKIPPFEQPINPALDRVAQESGLRSKGFYSNQ